MQCTLKWIQTCARDLTAKLARLLRAPSMRRYFDFTEYVMWARLSMSFPTLESITVPLSTNRGMAMLSSLH